MSIFKSCDIRGVYESEWDESDAYRIGCALGSLIAEQRDNRVCIGGDFRRSTPVIKAALATGLLTHEVKIFDLGQCSTPMVYFAARTSNVPNVAIVTASHNPAEYNGIKIMIGGVPAGPDLIRNVRDRRLPLIEGKEKGRQIGSITDIHPREEYLDWVVEESAKVLGPEKKEKRNSITVALDAMDGACTEIAPEALRRSGCIVDSFSTKIDPDYRRGAPNPAAEECIKPLQERVREIGADCGIALDGDGDRIVLVDEKGGTVMPEQLGVLLMGRCGPAPVIVFDQKCASILPKAAERLGGRAVMRPSGYGFIKSAMMEQKADIGVEVSGHHFFKILGGGDDGLFTALAAVSMLRQSESSLSALAEEAGRPVITPDLRVPFTGAAEETMDAVASGCGGRISRLDGVRADYEDGWALIRESITEPVLTVRVEGRTESALFEVARRFFTGVPELGRAVLLQMENVFLDKPPGF